MRDFCCRFFWEKKTEFLFPEKKKLTKKNSHFSFKFKKIRKDIQSFFWYFLVLSGILEFGFQTSAIILWPIWDILMQFAEYISNMITNLHLYVYHRNFYFADLGQICNLDFRYLDRLMTYLIYLDETCSIYVQYDHIWSNRITNIMHLIWITNISIFQIWAKSGIFYQTNPQKAVFPIVQYLKVEILQIPEWSKYWFPRNYPTPWNVLYCMIVWKKNIKSTIP